MREKSRTPGYLVATFGNSSETMIAHVSGMLLHHFTTCLNDHINLYGFWNETTFLTKSGDVAWCSAFPGADYESLDRSEQVSSSTDAAAHRTYRGESVRRKTLSKIVKRIRC
jgi:hypothetical protein